MEKKRILLVDDEPSFTRLLKLHLEETGHYVTRTENQGSKVMEAVAEFKPDLILMDIIMPDLDGGHLAAQIKESAQFKGIPIIFITAVLSKQEATAHHGLIAGHLFIAKPVSVEEVLQRIEEQFSKPSLSRTT